ncbi:hypothetical protein BASA81_015596 [Batrachochytrium salamandrivorans]|nr:hypothetical protein BASA81_015596 [Batrachochytrium salamandrivorans]
MWLEPFQVHITNHQMEAALDRQAFRRVVNCLGLWVLKQDVFPVRKLLGNSKLLNLYNIKNVVASTEEGQEAGKVILLHPTLVESDLGSVLLSFPTSKVEHRQVVVEYANLPADEVLRALLPAGVEVPSGFETVGHLAHLNLRPEQLPFKHRIGQVLLDKSNSNLKTIINKTGVIETQFRTFPMELLAGENNYVVEAKCNGYRFRFDYSKVYWNSKLSEEHERLSNKHFVSNQVLVVDAFCGVGPFAVRAATKGCLVLANDLNPESVDSLAVNAKLNKVGWDDRRQLVGAREKQTPQSGVISAFNRDARQFLSRVFHSIVLPTTVSEVHVVMNLPAIAIEFLDALIGALPETWTGPTPIVHCYCFAKDDVERDRQQDVQARIELVLQTTLDIQVRTVRDVAPKKYMMCASFPVPTCVESVKRARQL